MKTWLYGAQLLPFPSEERIGNKLKKNLSVFVRMFGSEEMYHTFAVSLVKIY